MMGRILASALLLAPLAVGCVTTVTEEDLEAQLDRAGASVSGLGRRQVVPIYAETRTIAWGLLAEAKMDASSPLSEQTSRSFRAASRRHVGVVIGGPYPELSDRVVRNALWLHRERGLRGLVVVFVSSEHPSPELRSAAMQAKVRLHHRLLE
jgi:hypothetical protein